MTRQLGACATALLLHAAGVYANPAADEDAVSGAALSPTCDIGEVFFRVARDRKVNFSNDDQMRVSIGVRF